MSWYLVLMVLIVMFGAITLAYRVYRMAELDAKSRGLKHPKFWGFFAMSGNNSSGLLLYLIGRRKYPSNMSHSDRVIMESHKKKAGVSLVIIAVSAIVLSIFYTLTL